MEEETEDGDDIEKFDLSLSASEMYSLNIILHYNIIEMDDVGFSRTAEAISREVSSVMNSEDFTEAMDNEVKAFKEEYDMSQVPGNSGLDVPGMGGGGVQ